MSEQSYQKIKDTSSASTNPDPLTKEPGSHPVGTAVGAAAGGLAAGAATGAALGTAAGPLGTAAGAPAGAVIGGLAGHGVAEHINPTVEDAYWRENHGQQWFAQDRPYDDYSGAYRLGYEGFGRFGRSGGPFDDYETQLRADYDRDPGNAGLSWDKARHAARAAWDRLSGNIERLVGYGVEDSANQSVGKVHNLWTDESGQPLFLGVKTGWLFGKNHVVPVQSAEVNDGKKIIRLPYTADRVKDAPSFDADAEIREADVRRIYEYYDEDFGVDAAAPAPTTERSARRTDELAETPRSTPASSVIQENMEERRVPLREEELIVGKREVEAGGIRLRKVVRIETVNQPVELKREEIIIERTASSAGANTADAFVEQDIYIPLRREIPVVEKQARVREEVHVGKTVETDRREVQETLRKEDVEINRETR